MSLDVPLRAKTSEIVRGICRYIHGEKKQYSQRRNESNENLPVPSRLEHRN
jgi:hypothetical protein